jgi:hypothetical protein
MMGRLSTGRFLCCWPFIYLEQEDIVTVPAAENPERVQSGNRVFRLFESHDGSYIKADLQGYQFPLDLNRRRMSFRIIRGCVGRELQVGTIQDRVVLLIGVNAQGVKNYFYTSQRGTLTGCPPISGIELYRYMAHQILRLVPEENHTSIVVHFDSLEAGLMDDGCIEHIVYFSNLLLEGMFKRIRPGLSLVHRRGGRMQLGG